MNRKLTQSLPLLLTALLLSAVLASDAPAAPVGEQEAVAAADFWFRAEVAAAHTKLAEADKIAAVKQMAARRVQYIVDQDILADVAPKGQVWAYLVSYQPAGFVVVSADDRIEPIIAFSAINNFVWDVPFETAGKVLVGRTLNSRLNNIQRQAADGAVVAVHPLWDDLRAVLNGDSRETSAYREIQDTDLILLDTAVWGQGGAYNDLVVANNGGTEVPTGCTATAMAILMRYFMWPWTGVGSESYTDNEGTVQYSHSANFGATYYNYNNMPTGNITSANNDVATLMYHCGVAVHMDYEPPGSGAWLTLSAMHDHFRFHGMVDRRSDHEAPMIESVKAQVPVILSTSKHTVVCDGHRTSPSPYFHINAGWGGGSTGWYSMSTLPGSDGTVDRSYPYSTPNTYIYVDISNTGTENGTLRYPWDTVNEGVSDVPSGGQLWIKGGYYSGATPGAPVNTNKAMLIQAYEGTVTIR